MKDTFRIALLRGIALAAGAIMIAVGIWRGEPGEVLMKAVKVCLECIGIG